MNPGGSIDDSWNRRSFLKAGAATAGLMLTGRRLADAEPSGDRLTDVNVSLSRWPLRRLPDDEPERLVRKLRRGGVTQAWAGTLDGLLHKDLRAANHRLTEDCQRFGEGVLLPFGSINPTLPGWAEELARCAKVHGMQGIRLHPNYHGYTLDDPRFARLLREATQLALIVQVALVMEDERMMHPPLRVDPVDWKPLPTVVQNIPSLRLVLLNALRTLQGAALRSVLDAGDVCVEISMLEGVGGIERILSEIPSERLLFGSHAPLFYFEAAEFKLRESSLSQDQLRAIRSENAARRLEGRRGAGPGQARS